MFHILIAFLDNAENNLINNSNQLKEYNDKNNVINEYESNTNSLFNINAKNLKFPVWVYGFIIVISIFLSGLSIAVIITYCCYKCQKTKKQKTIFNSNVPTLHAFNPTF